MTLAGLGIREVLSKESHCWWRLLLARICHAVVPEHRILSILRIVRIHRVDDLCEIVFRLRLSGLVLNCFESGEEQADQNRDDRDDDEQLDESEGVCVMWSL